MRYWLSGLLLTCSWLLWSQNAGTLDPNFGVNGRRLVNYSDGFVETMAAVIPQSDGSIVVSGTTTLNAGRPILARYTQNGDIDPNFGNNGSRIINFGNGVFPGFGMAIQADDKILLTAHESAEAFVLRLTADGNNDPTFGENGVARIGIDGANSFLTHVALQSDGKIVAVGNVLVTGEPRNYLVARFLPSGELDSSFGEGGRTIIPGENSTSFLNAVYVLDNGKIAATGVARNNGTNMVTMRFLADGSLDEGFGGTGIVYTSLSISDDEGWDIIPTENDGLLVGGRTINTSTTHTDFALVKFQENGQLDSLFGNNGTVITNPPGSSASLFRVLPLPDGKFIAGGAARNGSRDYDLTLVRYLPDGSRDPSFGANGISLTDFGSSADWLWDINFDANGNILGTGRTENTPHGGFDALTVRFYGTDQPDFSLVGTSSLNQLCANERFQDTLDLRVIGGFADSVEVRVGDFPPGANVNLSTPVRVLPPARIPVDISFAAVASGAYTINFVASSGGREKEFTYDFTITNEPAPVPVLLTPEEGFVTMDPLFVWRWEAGPQEASYTVEVSPNPSFMGPLAWEQPGTSNGAAVFNLMLEGVFYWRVRTVLCGEVAYSAVRAFQLLPASCQEIASSDVPIFISNNGEVTITSTLALNEAFPADLERLGVFIQTNHFSVGDLSATLRTPQGIEHRLFDRPGFPAQPFGCNRRGIQARFSDFATLTAEDFENTCDLAGANSYAIEGEYQSLDPNLENLRTLTSVGTWELDVTDHDDGAGGFLERWGFEYCFPEIEIPPVALINTGLEVVRNTSVTIEASSLTAAIAGV
ncbi:MAG: hypothetical protein AAF828_13140, partial [Bacteroidota bacterium]